jgi:signal transduction histidine kinase
MRSLRGRLTLGLTLVLAAVLVPVGAIVLREVDEDQRDAVDDRLVRTAELSRATALAAVQEELPLDDGRLDAVLRATRTSLRLTLSGRELVRTGDPAPKVSALPEGLSTFEHEGVRFRAYAESLPDTRLELTTRLTSLEERRDTLRDRLLLLGGLALLAAATGVFLATGFVLRPLRRLRHTAAGIAGDQDLERRVPADSGPSELRDLAASFNAMLARLGRSSADRERALAATRRFAADAGHELRTPLTSAQATLSSLARHPDLPPERRTTMARDALDAHRRLVELLDGLQALARGDAAAPHEPVDLHEVAQAALAAAAERHPEVDFACEAEAVEIDGWAPGLRSLVDNLLENAARHGGRRVRLTLDPHGLAVEDDGPGIPEEQRERVFAPFARGDDSTEGSGLGLAIVAQQAELHGATVTAGASESLGGARLAVSWPARPGAGPARRGRP